MSDDEHGYLPEAKGYFHTENDPEHQAQESEPSALVLASQGGEPLAPAADPGPVDEFDGLTNKQLAVLVAERGVEFDGNPAKANKASLLAALRA